MLNSIDRIASPAGHNGAAEISATVKSGPRWGLPTEVDAEAPGASLTGPSGVVSDDWDTLFGAVLATLRQGACGSPAAIDAPGHDPAATLHAIVQRSVAALDQLHGMLLHELGLRQPLERELDDARAALARAREALAGTQAAELRARHLALHDGLTSLPNRTCFHQRLDDALARGGPLRQPLAVLYLDLDGFKPINDMHGHDAGDELLRIVAARLSRAVRAGDMVSRVGGDEFACLLADLPGRKQLRRLACNLFDAVSAPVQVGELELTVRPSIGIAVGPADGASAPALLRSADAAMYAAKRERSGYAFYASGEPA